MVPLFIDINTVVYSDSFVIEYVPQEVLNKIRDKSITHNTFKIQDDESFLCGFHWFALNICSQEKLYCIILISFLQMTIKGMTK